VLSRFEDYAKPEDAMPHVAEIISDAVEANVVLIQPNYTIQLNAGSAHAAHAAHAAHFTLHAAHAAQTQREAQAQLEWFC
jgi:hypothetical protein